MAKVTQIYGWDDSEYLIVPAKPGTETAEILATVRRELDDGYVVLDDPDDVRIEWWRVNPCHPNSCGEGPHKGHWTQTANQTRGGFTAAQIRVGWSE